MLRTRPLMLLCFFLLCLWPFMSKAQFSGKARLDSLLQLLESENRSWGSVAISRAGKPVYRAAWGMKDAGKQLPANPDTRYRIGSVTKTFTAVMILQLTEEGQLTLDSRLASFFPAIPNAGKITVRDLLLHQSGLYNFTDSSNYLSYHTRPHSQQQLLDLFASHAPVFEPGEKTAYSNTNYVLLGFIIEQITGKDYSRNLSERILKKANLSATYAGGKINPANNEARSYSYDNETWQEEPETDMSLPAGAGAIVSTPSDMNRFSTALFSEALLKKGTLETMIPAETVFGMGLVKIPFGAQYGYGHTGGIDGFESMMIYFPGDSVAVSSVVNANRYSLNEIMIGVLSIYYGLPYTFPEFKPSIHLEESVLHRYEGTYSSPHIPLKITIRKEGKILTAQATGQQAFPLTPTDETEFHFETAGIVLLFTLEKDGSINKMELKQSGMAFPFEKE